MNITWYVPQPFYKIHILLFRILPTPYPSLYLFFAPPPHLILVVHVPCALILSDQALVGLKVFKL